MNTGTMVAIYMPLIIIFLIVIPQQRALLKSIVLKMKKRRGVAIMTNELLQKYIGKTCHISTGTFGVNLYGKIIAINENWIEVETKKGSELINSEFIQHIKVKGN